MKTCWLIYTKKSIRPNPKDNAFNWMIEEGNNAGFHTDVYFEEDFSIIIEGSNKTLYYKNEAMALPHFVILRTYNYALGEFFETNGVTMINSSKSLKNCQDKWQTHSILAENKIPMPKTILGFGKLLSFPVLEEQLGSPFILKGNYGSRGDGVYLIHSQKEMTDALDEINGDYIIQKFIASSYGRDIRVHVIGGKVIASVLRSSDHDFRSNFSQGGSAETVELTDEMVAISTKAAKAMNLQIAGVDLLINDHGVLLCEINGIPGFRTVWMTSKTNIPREIFHFLTTIKKE